MKIDSGRLPAGVLALPPPGTLSLRRLAPEPALAPYVAWSWSVEWDLRDHRPHRQVTLPHPSAHLVIETGVDATHAVTVNGPSSARFERVLEGQGRVVAVRFQPAGLRPFLRPVEGLRPLMRSLVDVVAPAGEVMSFVPRCSWVDVAEEVRAEPDTTRAMRRLQRALAYLPLAVDAVVAERVRTMNRLVARIVDGPTIVDVSDLARRSGLHPRKLQRDFAAWIGPGPKAVIRRHRLQAVVTAADRGVADWAGIAADLGYYDQAHLIRDFTNTFGVSPAAYARSLIDAQEEPP